MKSFHLSMETTLFPNSLITNPIPQAIHVALILQWEKAGGTFETWLLDADCRSSVMLPVLPQLSHWMCYFEKQQGGSKNISLLNLTPQKALGADASRERKQQGLENNTFYCVLLWVSTGLSSCQ